jgi:putative membrane-bound dehydrogenase-like protein
LKDLGRASADVRFGEINMKRLALASVFLALAAFSIPGIGQEAPKTHQVQLNGHTFTLAAGFEIELVAGPPLIDRPIVADFDDQGRLYVADSSGSNEKVEIQLVKRPHRIMRLEDTKGTGRFDRSNVFADRMMFPEGVLCFEGSVYVAAPPSIWKLTDTDGDGKADQRVEWFAGKTLTGCANDLHGPYRGPDGWIYWCKGAFAKQTYERPGQPPFVTRAAHIFRCRPDGSGIEPVMTGGMDNPVKVVFTPGGERIFTTTFFQHPGGGRRDGLVHAMYGGIYGKEHDVINDHPWTSPAVMPVLTHLGPAAPCGLIRYKSNSFGVEYQDNLFAALFNMHKVTRHVLTADGATFQSRDEDFLVSSNVDFHPTDLVEDADGSLLVIDTGGWYKLCCPTSWLHKPDVLGAIYRVRRTGAPHLDDPRGLKFAWAKLTVADLERLLDDPRPTVRRRAVQVLGKKGPPAVTRIGQVLVSSRSAEARRNAIWAATRIDHAGARGAVRNALADADEWVRQVALHSVSVWRDRDALPALLSMLKNASAHNRRAAAEALGRIGDKTAVPALLEAVGIPADRALEHSLTYALIEIGDREATAAGLRSSNVLTRRAALTALDQMKGGRLEARSVAPELASANPKMKETAWWIAGHHPEWADALAGAIGERLAAKAWTAAEQEDMVRQLARFARASAGQTLLADQLLGKSASPTSRLLILRAMVQAGLKEAPSVWIDRLVLVSAGPDKDLVREALVTLRSLRTPKDRSAALAEAMLEMGNMTDLPAALRLSALSAVPGGLTKVEPQLFTFLRAQLGSDQPAAKRSTAVDVLSRAKLNSEQLQSLIDALKTIGPMEVDRLLETFAQSADEKVGRSLIAALKGAPIRSTLRVDMLKPRLAKFGPDIQKQADELYAALNADLAKQQARLEELLAGMKDGDPRRGQAVFYSAKAACSSCHAIGYLGGSIGPDLTHIGKIRSERDLLESIVFPSASFLRSYEPVLVTTKSGKAYNGLLRKDAPEEVVLVTGATEEVRIARSDIDDMQPGKVSIMPAGLDQQLTPRELADLVAFLRACK